MIFFKKPIYKYQNMPFILDEFTDCTPDDEKCLIDIEAYGNIDGQMKYCYSSFSLKKPEMYENGDFESMLNLLRASENKTVLVKLKYKKGILKENHSLLQTESLTRTQYSFLPLQRSLTERFLYLSLRKTKLKELLMRTHQSISLLI